MNITLMDEHGASLCPDAERRSKLTDDEFWDEVWHRLGYGGGPDADPGDDDIREDDPDLGARCPECGERGACAFDVDGRPMIHAITDTDGATA